LVEAPNRTPRDSVDEPSVSEIDSDDGLTPDRAASSLFVCAPKRGGSERTASDAAAEETDPEQHVGNVRIGERRDEPSKAPHNPLTREVDTYEAHDERQDGALPMDEEHRVVGFGYHASESVLNQDARVRDALLKPRRFGKRMCDHLPSNKAIGVRACWLRASHVFLRNRALVTTTCQSDCAEAARLMRE
jgi:hypothetical protein